MKRISNWLIPPFLRRFDTFLLENHPVVWRTRIHFALFYSILAAVVLFVAGYCYAAPIRNFIVEPIKPIEIGTEQDFVLFLILSILAIIYWSYIQYLFKEFSESLSAIFIRSLIYAIGIFIIASVGTTAFHLGKVVQISYGLKSFDEIKKTKENYYLESLKKIAALGIKQKYDSNRQRKIVWNSKLQEDTILNNRYNSSFFNQIFDRLINMNILDQSKLSNKLYYNNQSSMNSLFSEAHLSDWSSLLYISHLHDSFDAKSAINSYLLSVKAPLFDTIGIDYDTLFDYQQRENSFFYLNISNQLDKTTLIVDNARLYLECV